MKRFTIAKQQPFRGSAPYRVRVRYQDCWEDGSKEFRLLSEARAYCERLLAGPLGDCAMYYVYDSGERLLGVLTGREGWRKR